MPAHDTTAAISEQLREALRATEKYMRHVPGTEGLVAWAANTYIDRTVEQAVSGNIIDLPQQAAHLINKLPGEHTRELAFAAQDAAVRRLWQQTRVVYDIDIDAWRSIGAADPKTVIPPQVRQALPHPNPLLIFPEPVVLTNPKQQLRQRVVGVYVTGGRKLTADPRLQNATNVDDHDRRVAMCSTHHPAATAWILTFAGLVEGQDGKPVLYDGDSPDIMWTRTTLHLDRENADLADLAAETLRDFDEMTGELAMGNAKQDVPLLLASTINTLIYLGAVNADLRPFPASRGGRTIPRNPGDKPGKVIGVGYQVGAQLRSWRTYEREHGRREHQGGTVRPHIRRAHHHTFRHGKGRKEAYVKWLWPIPINMRNGATETTIIPIKE